MDQDPRGRAGRGRRSRREQGKGNVDDAREKDAARFFVLFSSEKEMKKPWPPPSLSVSR